MNTKQIDVGGIPVEVVFKDIKNVHLSVHPPTGRVRIAAPTHMKLDTIRVYAISRIDWIKRNQKKSQILGPAGIPPTVVKPLSAGIAKALASKEVLDALSNQGVEPGYGNPAELDAFLKADTSMWAKLVKESGIKPQYAWSDPTYPHRGPTPVIHKGVGPRF